MAIPACTGTNRNHNKTQVPLMLANFRKEQQRGNPTRFSPDSSDLLEFLQALKSEIQSQCSF